LNVYFLFFPVKEEHCSLTTDLQYFKTSNLNTCDEKGPKNQGGTCFASSAKVAWHGAGAKKKNPEFPYEVENSGLLAFYSMQGKSPAYSRTTLIVIFLS
jgi:hypothetical protein